MTEEKCPFCGSKQILNKTPYIKPAKGRLGYEPETRYCCKAQAANSHYVKKRFHPGDAPDPEEVSKW